MSKNKGTVTYTLRADDSKIEADLNKANKTVEKNAKEAADKSEKIEDKKNKSNVESAEKTADKIKKSQDDVTKNHKEENDKQEEDSRKSYKEREDNAAEHGEKLKGIASSTSMAIGASMLAVGVGVAVVGVKAIGSATDMSSAMDQFIASTGKGTEETERYQKVLEDIYTNNYGEDFTDIADAMALITKNLGDMPDESLQELTESAFVLKDTFEYDIAESTRAAKALIDNFGLSGEKAMSMIAAGAQNGLDFSGELIDSINEYSTHFEKVGLDADDMFKIFENGAENGAWNLDKIGDLVKEMSIRVIDGSESTAEGFSLIGLNVDEMASKFAAGGDSAKEAFNETLEAIAGMDDALAQNTAGTALFGTMWEDLGADVVTQLADIRDGAYDTAGAMDEIKKVKYNDLGSMFESLKRSLEMLILPLGESLIPLLTDIISEIMPTLEECLPPLIERAAEVADSLLPIIADILPTVLELMDELVPTLLDVVDEILPYLSDLITLVAPIIKELVTSILPILADVLELLLPPLVEIVSALLPPLLNVVNSLLPLLQIAIKILEPIIELIVALLDPIVSVIDNAIVPLINILVELIDMLLVVLIPAIELVCGMFQGEFKSMLDGVSAVINNIKGIFEGIIDFIKSVFKGDWDAAWQAVIKIFENHFGMLVNLIKFPLNAVIGGINGVLEGINGIELPDWVPGIGGKSINIPLIPRLKKGAAFIPSDFYPAYLDYGERVLTREENVRYSALGGIDAIERAVSSPTASGTAGNNITYVVQEIDYDRMAAANEKLVDGMSIKCDSREFGRVIKELD